MPRVYAPIDIHKNEQGDEETERHPAFGLVQLRHRTGHIGRLFGSALEHHEASIALVVRRGEVNHKLGQDWFRTPGSERQSTIVEIEMSAAQFAQFITTPNSCDGVPCTLRYADHRELPLIPEESRTEASRVSDSYRTKIKHLAKRATDLHRSATDLLRKATSTKAEREGLLHQVFETTRIIIDHAPFLMDSFTEAAEKVVTAKKAEVDAFVTQTLFHLGLRAAQGDALPKLALPPPDAQVLPPPPDAELVTPDPTNDPQP